MSNIPRFVRVDGPGNERLVRDTHSMGILNTNVAAYKAAKQKSTDALARMAAQQKQTATVLSLQNEVTSMRSELTEIKALLADLLNKVS